MAWVLGLRVLHSSTDVLIYQPLLGGLVRWNNCRAILQESTPNPSSEKGSPRLKLTYR